MSSGGGGGVSTPKAPSMNELKKRTKTGGTTRSAGQGLGDALAPVEKLNRQVNPYQQMAKGTADVAGIQGDVGKAMRGDYRDVGRRGGGGTAGFGDGIAGGTPTVDPLKEHINSAPEYSKDMYGDAYDENKFGTTRTGYNVDDVTGYDVARLGGPGYEQSGYDVANISSQGYEGKGYEAGGYDAAKIEGMNFDPYRRNAMQDVTATSESDKASAEGALARTGGMSASDRMAMASQFNRDKISGRSGALGGVDELQAENTFKTGAANAAAQTGANRFGAQAGNQAAQFGAQAGNQAAQFGAQAANQAATANAQAQTASSKYDAEQGNTAAAWNAAQQTGANREKNTNQNRLREQNVSEQNKFNTDEQARKYKEQQDLYGTKRDEHNMKGQLMGGGNVY